MLAGQILSVTGADDLGARIVPQDVCRERDCSRVRLQGSRGHINNETVDFASETTFQLCCDKLIVPAMRERNLRVEFPKGTVHKRIKIAARECSILSRANRRHR